MYREQLVLTSNGRNLNFKIWFCDWNRIFGKTWGIVNPEISVANRCKILALVRNRYRIKRRCQFHGYPYTLKDLFCRLVYRTVYDLLNAFIVLYAGGTNIKTIIISNVHLHMTVTILLILFCQVTSVAFLKCFFRDDRVMNTAMVDDKIVVLSIALREPRA